MSATTTTTNNNKTPAEKEAVVVQHWPDMMHPSSSSTEDYFGKGTTKDLPSVRGVFNYQKEHVTKIVSRRDIGGSDGPLEGADWNSVEVSVRNGRGMNHLTLYQAGFELIHDPPSPNQQPINYYKEEDIINQYYSACETLVKEKIPGCTHVFAFDHNVRSQAHRSKGTSIQGGNLVQGPAALVHGDYTSISAPRRLQVLGEIPKTNDALKTKLGETPLIPASLLKEVIENGRRFMFVNVWRPLSEVYCKPLACVDASTVVEEDDLLTFQIIYTDRIGENYFSKYNPRHEWYYFPRMTPDEALLLLQWDSAGGGGNNNNETTTDGSTGSTDENYRLNTTKKATFALHSAFHDPSSDPSAPDRESIEVRLVVVF